MQEENRDDLVRLHDMLEAAQKIGEIARGMSRQSFDDDEVLQLALRHLVLIIGEAANNVSRARRERFPGIPWARIIGMRNHLAHGYASVDLNILWIAATENAPVLIDDLRNILKEDFAIAIEPFSLDMYLGAICAYCETQPIKRLSEFAPGFEDWIRPHTDIGLLVDYVPGAAVSLLDVAGHEISLGQIIGKRVSLFTTKGLQQSPYPVPFESGRRLYEREP